METVEVMNIQPLPSSNGSGTVDIPGAVPEMEFVLVLLNQQWPDKGLHRVKELILEGLDWRLVLRISIHHGVIDLVFDALRSTVENMLPESLADSLKANSKLSAHRNLYFSSELIHIVGLLEAGGIDVVSLKGPLLGSYLYGNISLRPFGDLDLVVRREDILRAKMILVEEGFRPNRMMSASDEREYIDSQFALTLTRKRGDFQTVAELHWALTHRFFSFRMPPDEMWDRTTQIDFSGTPITTLSRPLLLLFLCVHGAKHDWHRLIWLCDIVRLADKLDDSDWREFEALARKTRSVRIATVALDLGSRLLGYSPTERLKDLISEDKAGLRWAQRIADNCVSGSVDKLPKLQTMRFQTGVRENVNDRWGSYLQQIKLLITPTQKDRDFLRLPRFLAVLYYAVRPVRIVWQRLGRVLR